MEATGAYVKDIRRVSGWAIGWLRSSYCVLVSCLLSLSLCRATTHMEATGAYVKDIRRLSGAIRWLRSNYCVLGGCLLSLSLCRRDFHDLLKVRPSSLLMLCGCISSSVTSLMSWSVYLVLAERSFVPCSLIMWSWLMLCYATADLSVCASLICLLCSLNRIWMDHLLCSI
jgi:hypothetical protein